MRLLARFQRGLGHEVLRDAARNPIVLGSRQRRCGHHKQPACRATTPGQSRQGLFSLPAATRTTVGIPGDADVRVGFVAQLAPAAAIRFVVFGAARDGHVLVMEDQSSGARGHVRDRSHERDTIRARFDATSGAQMTTCNSHACCRDLCHQIPLVTSCCRISVPMFDHDVRTQRLSALLSG